MTEATIVLLILFSPFIIISIGLAIGFIISLK